MATKTFNLGSVDLIGTGKRYPVSVTITLREPNSSGKTEFTACASAGRRCGGQCLDTINAHRDDFTPENRELWDVLYMLWRNYHLNTMHAGTPEQELAIRDWQLAGNRYDYRAACNMLAERGIYEVQHNGKPYRYGSGWITKDIPADVLKLIHNLLN